MNILRAVFWLTVIALLLPQETALGRSEMAERVGKSPTAPEISVQADFLSEFKALTLKNLYRLKQLRAAQNDVESSAST
jgi:hypothetical protein